MDIKNLTLYRLDTNDKSFGYELPAVLRWDGTAGQWSNSNQHILFIEPITTTTVALWLAEGAVAYLGGMAMGAILGHPSLNDIAKLLRECVEELKNFVRDELKRQFAEQDFLHMTAALASVRDNLRNFDLVADSAKPQVVFMAQDAYLKAGEVMSLSNEYGLNGLTIYANATSLRMVSLAAQSRVLPSGTLRATMEETLRTSESAIANQLQIYSESWNPDKRVSQVVRGPASSWDGTYQPAPMSNWCAVDGVWEEAPHGTDALAFRNQLIERVRGDSEKRVAVLAGPMANVVESWRKAVSVM